MHRAGSEHVGPTVRTFPVQRPKTALTMCPPPRWSTGMCTPPFC